MEQKLYIDNHRVCDFYRSHPYINFEDMNIFIVDMFEKILEKTNIDNSQNILQLLERLQKDNFESVLKKFAEIKREYCEELKNTLSIHTNDKITPAINHYNQITQDKIKIMLNTLENKIEHVLNSNNTNMDKQMILTENISTLIKKMENSSIKGAISEKLLYNVLLNLFANAEIDFTNQEAHHGDIILKRKNKFDILFENKEYNYNVPKREIDKFIDDINLNNCCGVMISQKSGIALKDNFEIEIHKGHVVIYLHNVNYSAEIIKTAINIIDHLQGLVVSDTTSAINIDKEMLDSINIEYKNHAIKKIEHIESIKNMSSKLIKQAEELKYPSIEALINKYYTGSINNEHLCTCGKVWTSKRSLASHQKMCEKFKLSSII